MYKTMNSNYQRTVNAKRNKNTKTRGPSGKYNSRVNIRVMVELAKMDADLEAERAARHIKYAYNK